MNEELKKRLKSFAWRSGMLAFAVVLDYAVESLTTFNLPPELVVIIGLVFGEISKTIKKQIDFRKEVKELESL